MMILITIIAFVFILGLLIFVHELGHFVAAKRAGMKVEEFGFGFPPRLFGVKKGETIYSVNWIPLGGFVKILGEDETTLSDPRAFGAKPFFPRLLTLLAGVGMNFLTGWFLIFLGLSVIGIPIEIEEGADLGSARIDTPELRITYVDANSPAQTAGFKIGDKIVSVDGQTISQPGDFADYNRSRAGQNVVYELQRGNEKFERSVVPRADHGPETGPVGFAVSFITIGTYPLGEALTLSFQSFWAKVVGIFMAFGALFKLLFTEGRLVEGIAGPVGIAALVKDFLILGFPYVVQLTAVLSINLAVINAVPFPALDGGRVLFLIIEKIRGVKSVRFERAANAVGFILLLLLMAAVTFGDITKFSDQFKRLFERIL